MSSVQNLGFRLIEQRRRRMAGGGGPTTIASDTFNRADSPTGLGTTSVGSKAWTNVTGGPFSTGLAIVSNAAVAQDATRNGAVINAGVSDCTVSAKLNHATDPLGLILRFTDVENYIRIKNTGTSMSLEKIVAGSLTVLAAPAVTWVAGDVLAVVMSGNTFTIKRNGTTLATVTDANAFATNTTHGLFIDGATTSIDDFAVTVP